MKLRYDTSISADPAPLILQGPGGLRVEIHIRHEPEGTATLLALSGAGADAVPAKTVQQGPFEVHEQATAAKRAISAQLLDEGFAVASDQQPLWSLAVQRSVNESRRRKRESSGDYRFDPKDVFLDW